MTKAPTRPSNLFAAALSYALAMERILPDPALPLAQPMAMPFYFLGGFSLELSLKAAILSSSRDRELLRKLGHDLNGAFEAASAAGYLPPTGVEIGRLIHSMHEAHKGLAMRYVPDVEVITLPGPQRLMPILKAHLSAIEQQFDVWEDSSSEKPR